MSHAQLEARRRRRRARTVLFDRPPTADQLAAQAVLAERARLLQDSGPREERSAAAATAAAALISAQPQQTRHARRLYIGQLPTDLTENEVSGFFRDTIKSVTVSEEGYSPEEDPILSVYINRERRFAFVEFRSVEMCTACLQFDGINILGRGAVKVKRPNDYNVALAPRGVVGNGPTFDMSRVGIVSSSVPDGPNKIFIGGIPYHLTDDQVSELLSAFGPLRAFHLVRDAGSPTSKGYGFCEYAETTATVLAVAGLNGMDMGGGKTLSARMASVRGADGTDPSQLDPTGAGEGFLPIVMAGMGMMGHATPSGFSSTDVKSLLEIALGGKGRGVSFGDVYNVPPHIQALNVAAEAAYRATGHSMGSVVDTVAAVTGSPGSVPPLAVMGTGGRPPLAAPVKTRIVVLSNMVAEEDLATEEDFRGLYDEVFEECAKFGKLNSMVIPRPGDKHEDSAVRKIYLEYETIADAVRAEGELAGRKFGPNTVEVAFFDEEQYKSDKLF